MEIAIEGIKNPALGPSLQGKSGQEFFSDFLPKMIGVGLLIGALIFFFVMVVGAIQWITSGGDKNAIEGARGKLLNAITGIIILFAVFAIVKVIENFFGIHILSLDIGPLQVK